MGGWKEKNALQLSRFFKITNDVYTSYNVLNGQSWRPEIVLIGIEKFTLIDA